MWRQLKFVQLRLGLAVPGGTPRGDLRNPWRAIGAGYGSVPTGAVPEAVSDSARVIARKGVTSLA
jgi:hypothetical protein